MLAEKVAVMARHIEPDDILVVECDGFDLEPYAIEYDEHAGTLVIKCISPEDDDTPEAEDEEEEVDVCAVKEREPGSEPVLVVG